MEISGKNGVVVGGASGFGKSSAELLPILDNPMLNGQCLRLDAGQRFGPKL